MMKMWSHSSELTSRMAKAPSTFCRHTLIDALKASRKEINTKLTGFHALYCVYYMCPLRSKPVNENSFINFILGHRKHTYTLPTPTLNSLLLTKHSSAWRGEMETISNVKSRQKVPRNANAPVKLVGDQQQKLY